MGLKEEFAKIDWKEVGKRKRKPKKDTRTAAEKAKQKAIGDKLWAALKRGRKKK